MLKLKEKPQTKAAQNVTFDQPVQNQKIGIEMLISLNTTNKEVITGPDFDIDQKILVTKLKPHFFFNPTYIVPEDLNIPNSDSIIKVNYQDYMGNQTDLAVNDASRILREAIDYINNGRKRKRKAKNAD